MRGISGQETARRFVGNTWQCHEEFSGARSRLAVSFDALLRSRAMGPRQRPLSFPLAADKRRNVFAQDDLLNPETGAVRQDATRSKAESASYTEGPFGVSHFYGRIGLFPLPRMASPRPQTRPDEPRSTSPSPICAERKPFPNGQIKPWLISPSQDTSHDKMCVQSLRSFPPQSGEAPHPRSCAILFSFFPSQNQWSWAS